MSETKKKFKKAKIVFIYGPIATGKLTVAKELQKIIKYKLLHNHMILDFAEDFYSREDIEWTLMRQWLQFDVTKYLTQLGTNVIFTHAYSKSYTHRNGVSDLKFVKKIESIIRKYKGDFYPVYITSDREELMKRVSNESRKKHLKLTDSKKLKEILDREDFSTHAPFKNNLIINNSDKSPKKVAKIIANHFNLL